MKKEDKNVIIFIIVLIVFIILYAISAGRVNIINNDEESEAIKRENAKKDHEIYSSKLKNDKKELAKIQRKRKIIFFLVRLFIVGTWFTVNIILLTKSVPDLSTLVLYNEVLILIILSLLFLFAGSLTSVREMLEYLKITVDNKLYQRRLKDLSISIQKSEKGIQQIEKNYPEIIE